MRERTSSSNRAMEPPQTATTHPTPPFRATRSPGSYRADEATICTRRFGADARNVTQLASLRDA